MSSLKLCPSESLFSQISSHYSSIKWIPAFLRCKSMIICHFVRKVINSNRNKFHSILQTIETNVSSGGHDGLKQIDLISKDEYFRQSVLKDVISSYNNHQFYQNFPNRRQKVTKSSSSVICAEPFSFPLRSNVSYWPHFKE